MENRNVICFLLKIYEKNKIKTFEIKVNLYFLIQNKNLIKACNLLAFG
jgi:hypothetical protein